MKTIEYLHQSFVKSKLLLFNNKTIIIGLILLIQCICPVCIYGQEQTSIQKDSTTTKEKLLLDSLDKINNISPDRDTLKLNTDSLFTLSEIKKIKRDWTSWRPNAKRAMWLAMVIPGGGQIYNRKYWKLPIFYGGFVGCIYALRWNGQMYKDYSQAYLDIMDDDPNTQSYNQFLHLGTKITSANIERYKTIFKNRKDKYRRWRDLSFFCLLGVYAVSIIDAYVDAEMSNFDISRDLSMKIRPTLMNSSKQLNNPLSSTSLGLQCSLNF